MNDYQPAVKQSNTMGLVGFIISLVSLVGCGGVLSPISLIFSLIGLGKEPRGFAIAGLVLSLVSMPCILVGVLLFGFALPIVIITFVGLIMSGVGVVIAIVLAGFVAIAGQNAIVIADSINDYYQENSVIPASLNDLGLTADELTDTWGNEFIYVPGADGDSYMLISAGPDGIIANEDDLLGEVSLDGGLDVDIHHGYDEVNRTKWGGLPIPDSLPEVPDAEDEPEADSFPTPDPPQDPEAP